MASLTSFSRLLLVAPSVVLFGCGYGPGESDRIGSRTISPVAWDTVFQISSSVEDTVILIPRLYVVDHEGNLYVFDYGDSRLKAFDRDGQLKWSFGGKGQGPGEFSQVVDLALGADGDPWVMDTDTNRITVVSNSGEMLHLISLSTDQLIRDIVVLPDQTFIGTGWTSDNTFLYLFDMNGRLVSEYAYPDPILEEAFNSTRQTYSVKDELNDNWLALFPFGNLFFIYNGINLICQGRLIEGETFPTTMPTGPPDVWAIAGAIKDSLVYVLPKSETEISLRAIDIYSVDDCKYIKSINLPGEFKALHYRNETFFLATEDPAPLILGLKEKKGVIQDDKGG